LGYNVADILVQQYDGLLALERIRAVKPLNLEIGRVNNGASRGRHNAACPQAQYGAIKQASAEL
jgi:hypothetical protein